MWPTQIPVTEHYTYGDGENCDSQSFVDFLLDTPMTDSVTGDRVAESLVTAQLNDNGLMAITLDANDDPTTLPAGTAYLVTERIFGQPERRYYVVIPSAATGGVALGTLIPGDTAPPIYYGLGTVTAGPGIAVTTVAGVATVGMDIAGLPSGRSPVTDGLGNILWPPGGGGGGDLTFVYTQGPAATLWTVNHNLGKYPSVTVVDSGGTVVVGLIHHVNSNTLTILFSAPFGGSAYCN